MSEPEARANSETRSVSMSKHGPRAISTPDRRSIFEWNVAMRPVPTKPTTGGVRMGVDCSSTSSVRVVAVLPAVVECGSWQEVVDVILYEEVEHGIVTRCVEAGTHNVVAEIDLTKTAIVGFTDMVEVRVLPHPWALRVAREIHSQEWSPAERYEAEKPTAAGLSGGSWRCRFRVDVEWT